MNDYIDIDICEESNIIPDTCLSFSEMSDYITLLGLDEYKRLLESIGVDELAVFESTGSLIVYEETTISELREKVRKSLNKVWSACEEFWTKVQSYLVKDSAVYAKFKAINLANLPEDKNYGKTHTFFAPSDIKFSSNMKEFARQAKKLFTGLMIADVDQEKAREAADKLAKGACAVISGCRDAKDTYSMKKLLREKLMGGSVNCTANWVKANKTRILDTLSTGSNRSYVMKEYNDCKSAYKELINHINNMDAEYSKVTSWWAASMHMALGVMQSCYSVEMDVYKRKYTEYKMVALRAIKACEKSVKEDTDMTNASRNNQASVNANLASAREKLQLANSDAPESTSSSSSSNTQSTENN